MIDGTDAARSAICSDISPIRRCADWRSKQIYAFRGADIFTYMKARSEVSALYPDTNWRSRAGTR